MLTANSDTETVIQETYQYGINHVYTAPRPYPRSQQGEVVAVGKGKSNDEGKVFPLDVKAGDTILFGKYSGTEIKLDGEELLIMREEEVLGIVSK